MFKKFFLVIIFAVGIFFASNVEAASFFVSPASGDLTAMGGSGCSKTIDVFINTDSGESTNGAQIYIEHDFVGSGESISISGGGLFNTYSSPDILPSPVVSGNKVIGLVGYGGNKSGSNLRFARITVRSASLLETKELTIRFNSSEIITSKIADAVNSENILNSVSGASYTVKSGFCESTPPQIINVNPANQKPNHKVSDPITFQISDSGGSGVDVNTLEVSVSQIGWSGSVNVISEKINDNLYSITVNQDTDFVSERKVDWTVSVSDKAGNNKFVSYYFNDLSCADLGCSGGDETITDCADNQDNDGDNFIDELDPGCQNEAGVYDSTDNSEYDDNVCNPETCAEIKDCADGIDNDGDGRIDNQDSGCYLNGVYDSVDNNEYLAACNDGIDNDGDGLIDLNDLGCQNYDDNSEVNNSGEENPGTCGNCETQCNDGIDNDGDGFIDLSDNGCVDPTDNNEYVLSDNTCEDKIITETDTNTIFENNTIILVQCQDGIDNDGDGLVDLNDNDCENALDNSEYHLPVGAVLDISDVKVYLANRTINARLNSYNSVSVLAGSSLGISVNTTKIPATIKSAKLYFKDTSYDLYFDQGSQMYIADLLAPTAVSSYSALIKIEHGTDGEEILPFSVFVLPYGKIVSQIDNDFENIDGAVVTLQQLSGENKYKLIQTVETDENGFYGFTVPNGAYKLTVKKDGYLISETSGFTVDNFIVNRNFNLIKKINLLDPEITVAEKAGYLADVGTQTAGNVIDSFNDPKIEKTVERVVAPAAIATTLALAVPALSFLSLLSYLRALVLLPFTLFSKKKRKEWGIVYNSLNKMPVDLITVRLVDDKTDRIVQTAVTDSKGRYKFFAEPGIYRIVVATANFIYPTKILQDISEDTSFQNIYHGAPIHIDENTSAIIQNIPIDPVGANKTPRRIIISNLLTDIRHLIISVSLVVGILAMVVKPNLYVGILLAVQILFYILYKKFSSQKKFKNYGIIFDKDTKKPLAKAIIRLYDSKFNKLISTQVTDNKGRYSFLAGKNNYYLTVEKEGFKERKLENINIAENDESAISKDIAIEKNK
ncbi:MAG: carboxypeptidase-like regulatory domain-containing protein [Patescibacteria group bacterium]